MPSLESFSQNDPIKLLLLGNSGAGKTGLLASLAKDYRLFIADFDNGLPILMDEKILSKDLRKNIYFKSFYDKMNLDAAGKLIPAAAGWQEFIRATRDWTEDGKSLGNLYSWGPSDVFVIDSLTFMGNTIFNYVLQLAGRSGQRPQLQDYGAAIDSQEALIETLYNPAVRCNIVVTSHIQVQGDELAGGVKKGFPSALGTKLPPKLGRYFNNVVLVQKSGSGNNVKREILTTATHQIDLKVSKPSKIPATMEPDLNKLFQLLKSS